MGGYIKSPLAEVVHLFLDLELLRCSVSLFSFVFLSFFLSFVFFSFFFFSRITFRVVQVMEEGDSCVLPPHPPLNPKWDVKTKHGKSRKIRKWHV